MSRSLSGPAAEFRCALEGLTVYGNVQSTDKLEFLVSLVPDLAVI